MRLVLSPFVAGDLRVIGDYIGRDNPERALRFLEKLQGEFHRLERNSKLIPSSSRDRTGIQACPFRDYLILDRVQPEFVRIDRVLHRARRLANLFVQEGQSDEESR